MSKQLSDIEVLDIVPDSIKRDANVKASSKAINGSMSHVSENIDMPVILKNIDRLSSVQLDHLARQYDATWRDSWGLSLKRSIIKATIQNKRIVGTIKAVKNALSAISSTAEMVEWWETEPKGDPHTFTIVATASGIEGGIDAELQEDLILQIDSAKPVRSWYTLRIQDSLKGGFNICGVLRSVTYARISHLR